MEDDAERFTSAFTVPPINPMYHVLGDRCLYPVIIGLDLIVCLDNASYHLGCDGTRFIVETGDIDNDVMYAPVTISSAVCWQGHGHMGGPNGHGEAAIVEVSCLDTFVTLQTRNDVLFIQRDWLTRC